MGFYSMSSESSVSLSSKIQHHLANWDAHVSILGLKTTIHLDSVFMSIFLLVALGLVFNYYSTRLTLSPSRSQNFLESIVDTVYKEVFSASPEYTDVIGPLGLTVFIAVLLMNMMDFLPSSIGGSLMVALGSQENFKVVPTADVNVTLALSVFCFFSKSVSRSANVTCVYTSYVK